MPTGPQSFLGARGENPFSGLYQLLEGVGSPWLVASPSSKLVFLTRHHSDLVFCLPLPLSRTLVITLAHTVMYDMTSPSSSEVIGHLHSAYNLNAI